MSRSFLSGSFLSVIAMPPHQPNRCSRRLILVTDQPVQVVIAYEHGSMVAVSTNSPFVDHFLHTVKMCHSTCTWISYAHDLKIFFHTLQAPLHAIDRRSCVRFMEAQDRAGLSSLTINRRLAAVSSLFTELNLLDPDRFPQNPVAPLYRNRDTRRRGPSLYRRQPDRVPSLIAEKDLQAFFAQLPTWRDRTLILLMWISCLRISEAVSIRFEQVECSNRSIRISHGKGGVARMVYMDRYTFAALNTYLDEERRTLFPEVDEVFVAFKGVARGRPLSVNAFQHAIDYYAEQCGLALHAHLFRHTGISQLVMQGMSEPAIRQLVGHRNAQSLEPYVHLSDRFVESEFAKAQAVLQPAHWLPLPREIPERMDG
jgi:site-specific recombinase XerD